MFYINTLFLCYFLVSLLRMREPQLLRKTFQDKQQIVGFQFKLRWKLRISTSVTECNLPSSGADIADPVTLQQKTKSAVIV